MNNADLLHWLGYVWTAFGAYWMSFNVLKKVMDSPGSRGWHFTFLAITFVALFAERHKIPPALILIFAILWTALGLYWGAPSKAAQSGELKWYRPLRLLVLATVFALLFWNATAIGILGKRFVPNARALAIIGFLAAVAGMFVSSWARLALGKFWSDKVIVQAEHQLVRTGPYSRMRHPLYSGVLLAVLGTALVLGEWRGVLSFALLLTNYVIKAKKEEHILAEQFRDEFEQHCRSTGFLLPRLRE